MDNKLLNWILHGVSLLAILLLFLKLNSSIETKSTEAPKGEHLDSNASSDFPVAYFLSDTLLSNLDFFKTSEAEFKKKQESMQNEIKAKESSLQKELQRLQENAPNLTRNELEQGQQKLAKMEQELMIRRENLGAQLAEETAEFNEKLHSKITSFLKDLNSDKRYRYIFSVQREGNIFYSDSGLDITPILIKGMNEKYGTK